MSPDHEPPAEDERAASAADAPAGEDLWPDSPAAAAAADAKTSEGVPAPRRLQYMAAIRYTFDNPEWFVSMVMTCVCLFIPVLGQVAIWGFVFEVLEALHRQPDCTYPKFDLKRFGAYCTRGVWPFVLLQAVQVTLQLILQLPIQFSFQGMVMLLVTNPQVGAIVLAIGLPLILLFLLALAIGVSLFTAPVLLRAGLTQDFRQVFYWPWIKGYLRRMWVEEVLSALFLLVATAVLLPLGCLLFCVGALGASVVLLIAGAHMRWQLYEIYLEKGGEPIPLHPLPAEVPPVPAFTPQI